MKRIAAAVMFMAAAVAAHGQASGLSGTVRVMKRTLKAIIALAFAATVATAQDTNFAVRISCDFQQQAGAAELPDLTLLQGSAPMIQAAPMRMGRAVAADSLTTCQLVFGPSATSTYYVATNAYLATNRAYYIQLGTIGTNSVPAGSNSPAAWWYSILFYRNGGIYWSGSGRLYIERTTATGANGLVWQEWEAGAAKDDIARAWIALLSNEVESIESSAVVYGTSSNTAYRGDWGASASNLAAQAAGWGDHGEAGYLEDAPGTGGPYARQSNGWVAVTVGSGTADPAPSKSLGASAVGWSILNTNNAPFVAIITDANMGAMLNFPLDTVNAVDAMPIVSDTSASITQLVFVARAYAAGGSEWGTVGLKTTFGGSILTNVITLTNAPTTQTVTLAHAPVSGPCVVPFSWGILPTSTVGTAVGNVRFNVMQARGSW